MSDGTEPLTELNAPPRTIRDPSAFPVMARTLPPVMIGSNAVGIDVAALTPAEPCRVCPPTELNAPPR